MKHTLGGDSPNLQTVLRYPLLHGLSEALPAMDVKHIPQRTPQSIQLQHAGNTADIFEAYLRNFYIYSGMFHKVVVTAEHRDSCSYLVGEVSCQIIVLPGEVLIIQLS